MTIFSRLVFGYLTIFVLVIILSFYTIVRMGEFSEVTYSVLMSNNRMIDFTGKLTDTVLSQIRYERKFVVTKDSAFYSQFMRLKSDFDQYAEQALSLARSSQVRRSLNSAKESYHTYQSLFDEEARHLKAGTRYPQQWYKEEKEKVVNGLIEELEKVKLYSQHNTDQEIERLYEAGTRARKIAMAMAGGFLVFSLVLSFLIQRSITRPIAIMKKKTREIAKGNFEDDLDLSSPPEVAELARAFNLMCSKLKQLDKMKSDFFSSMSHELRNPLSTIRMGIQLLSEKSEVTFTEKQKKLLTILSEESARVLELVNSMLDLSKMEAGMMTYHLEKNDLSPLIDQAIKEMQPLAEAKKINLSRTAMEALPILEMDGERILQALRNLIGNAVKFTPAGGRVTLSAQPTDGGVRGVRVSVADTGPGIPAESLSSIFDKYQQVTPNGSHPVKGTGLGLALVKEIIASHGGKVWAESKTGQGSTFIFILPA
ncbi:MAG: HAMP domain-containing sensor histidine kinase [Deltaproteobacteria bacterium]